MELSSRPVAFKRHVFRHQRNRASRALRPRVRDIVVEDVAGRPREEAISIFEDLFPERSSAPRLQIPRRLSRVPRFESGYQDTCHSIRSRQTCSCSLIHHLARKSPGTQTSIAETSIAARLSTLARMVSPEDYSDSTHSCESRYNHFDTLYPPQTAKSQCLSLFLLVLVLPSCSSFAFGSPFWLVKFGKCFPS